MRIPDLVKDGLVLAGTAFAAAGAFLIVLSFLVVAPGCAGAFREKAQRYEEAGRMAANPDKIEVLYRRNGNEATLEERRCSGDCPEWTRAPKER